MRADPFVRADLLAVAAEHVADRLSGAHRQGAVWGHRVRGVVWDLPRGRPPGIGSHTTAFVASERLGENSRGGRR
jgi:hypothetical protein